MCLAVLYEKMKMEREIKTYAPVGCEIKSVKIVDGVAVMKYGEIERKLPKSWEEFCEMYPVKKIEYYIEKDSRIRKLVYNESKRNEEEDRNLLPDSATAEAVLALCQLIQLRNAYNGDWVPDWEDVNEKKHAILFFKNEINTEENSYCSISPLFFKSRELREEFLRNFRPLIEKLKPLYGIKIGGEE